MKTIHTKLNQVIKTTSSLAESATVVKCAAVIPHEYTQAYNPHLYKDGEE